MRVANGNLPRVVVEGTTYKTSSDETAIRDYIHVCDAARANVEVLKRQTAEQESGVFTLNIGTGKSTSVLELIDTFSKTIGKQIAYDLQHDMPHDSFELVADMYKSRKLINF